MAVGACTIMGGHILPMDPVAMVLGAADHVKCAMNKEQGAITQHGGRRASANPVTGIAFLDCELCLSEYHFYM